MLPLFAEDKKDFDNDQGCLQLWDLLVHNVRCWYALRVLCNVHSYSNDLVMPVSTTIDAASPQQNLSGA